MKMVIISADDYEKLSNAKKESETKIESYKQCIAGYESRIKELTEERDNREDEIKDLEDLIGLLKSDRMSKNETIKKLDKELDERKGEYSDTIAKKEKLISVIKHDKYLLESCIGTLRSQLEEYANKTKELRLKYEAVLKANENLAAENSRLANDPEITRLNNELKILKKHFKDLDNAYKSQKNELLKLKNKPDYKYDILREQYNCLYTDYERAKMVIDDYKKKIYENQSLANV